MRDPRHENTMYLLRSKSVKYVSAYQYFSLQNIVVLGVGHLKLGQRLNLNVIFDWLNTEICVTLLHEMLQMVDTRRNLLRAMLQK